DAVARASYRASPVVRRNVVCVAGARRRSRGARDVHRRPSREARTRGNRMTLDRALLQAARMMLRDWRAGELRLLAAALVIAVAAVTSVGFFVDRIRLGLERDATQLLGADLVLSSDQPIQPELSEHARESGLKVAQTVAFPSMAINAGDTNLTM